MRTFGKLILKLIVLYFFKDKTIYYVTGMRRSGNHAFVKWLTNALEEELIEFFRIDEYPNLNYTKTGKTVFLNEVNMVDGDEYLEILWNNRKLIRNCSFLIISTEDCKPNYRNWRIPRFDHAIYVKRSVLNVIASRLRKLHKKADQGVGWPRQYVNDSFFEKLIEWQNPPKRFLTWNYDNWITSKDYRLDFLNSLDLNIDIMPSISSAGGGSSFTGKNKVPSSQEALNRFRQIEFSETILKLLFRNKKILAQSELKYLDNKYASFKD